MSNGRLTTYALECRGGHAFEAAATPAAFVNGEVPCPTCGTTDCRRRRFPAAVPHRVTEAIGRYQSKPVQSHSLPLNYPGADSYSSAGVPQFESRRKLKEAGKRFGLEWG